VKLNLTHALSLDCHPIMAAASSDGSGLRSWWTLLGGVAVASSALTTLSILGVQRLHRKQRRHELEEDIRRATKGHGKDDSHGKEGFVERKATELGNGDIPEADTAVPRYLAALTASQEGVTSQASSPRPSSRPSSTGAHFHHLARQPSLQMKPSLSSASSIRDFQSITPTYDESLIREQLSRNYSFLGDEAMSKVRDAFVVVVGAGGVGSWCALMLLRSGVGRLRLIDFDQVSLSSLNRHACANLADVGKPKVVVCKEHFAQIAPWAEVEAQVEIFRGSDAARLLGQSKADTSGKSMEPTYVIDAIDNLETKVDLLAYCYKNRVQCFSSMGAGAKADPGQIQIADLNMTAEDPLARRVRRGLRAQNIWSGGAMLPKKEANRSRKEGATPKGHAPKKSKREKQQKQEASAIEEEKKSKTKREEDHQATLEKLESRDTTTASNKLKLQSSGRRAEIKGRQPSTPAEAMTVPSNGSETVGYSRYSVSRRASTASSRGSAQFFSPLSTPDEEGSRSFESQMFKDGIEETFRLPEAVETNEAAKDDSAAKRPALSTLLSESSSSEAGPSRRTSSLKELVAEDVRSSQSGKVARRSTSGVSLMEDVEEEVVVEEHEAAFKIMCVYSNEKSDTRLLPLDEEEFQRGKVEELAALEDFRVRILPVLGPLPAMFGLAAATYVICDIAGKRLETVPWKNRRKTYDKVSFPSP
jgi:tRNA A37 threonylcarbamoyladenosine dehydratase